MIYLVQTDTTAGFASQNLHEINKAKNRDENQPCLITISKFSVLKNFTRVPQKFKNFVRKAKKTTIIYPNFRSFRVVKSGKYSQFLDKISWCYSSSANRHGKGFDLKFAKSVADEIVGENFYEDRPSKIFRISKTNKRKERK